MSENEREDLEGLISSPGWQRFLQYARKEWGGEGYGLKLKLAVTDAIEKNQNPAEAVHRVDAANDAVNALLSWPQTRVQSVIAREQQKTTVHLGRGGVL